MVFTATDDKLAAKREELQTFFWVFNTSKVGLVESLTGLQEVKVKMLKGLKVELGNEAWRLEGKESVRRVKWC